MRARERRRLRVPGRQRLPRAQSSAPAGSTSDPRGWTAIPLAGPERKGLQQTDAPRQGSHLLGSQMLVYQPARRRDAELGRCPVRRTLSRAQTVYSLIIPCSSEVYATCPCVGVCAGGREASLHESRRRDKPLVKEESSHVVGLPQEEAPSALWGQGGPVGGRTAVARLGTGLNKVGPEGRLRVGARPKAARPHHADCALSRVRDYGRFSV